jgi:hypothetical protein
MTTTKLKLADVLNLEAEINGFTNPQTNEKVVNGLLNEKLSLVAKYWLNDLAKKALEIKTDIDKLRDELIKKYGEDDGTGNIGIVYSVDAFNEDGTPMTQLNEAGEPVQLKRVNPKFIEFQNEYETLLQEEREVEHYEFTLSQFESVETADNIKVFFTLIK